MISANPSRPVRRLLVTGFGAFPAAPVNPSELIVRALRRERLPFRRFGCDLRCAILPVRFGTLEDELATLADRHRPDVILHVGVAVRRHLISVETRAWNHANPKIADAAGERPPTVLVPSGPTELVATYPAPSILSALAMASFDAELSMSAGDYVCNAALYQSLLAAHAPEVGFLHVPRPSRASANGRGPSLADLTAAVRLAILVLSNVPAETAMRLGRASRLPPCAA